MKSEREVYVSVDVETAGPIPGVYSLLSIGACVVDDLTNTFSCELVPINRNADPAALKVTGLSLDDLERRGMPATEAMHCFSDWLASLHGVDDEIVFVGLNAPFDWSFINYYFHRFIGRNPFGFAALDIKAYFMGSTGCRWSDTRSSDMARALTPQRSGDHNALHDALYQAELFTLMRGRSS
jgi:DNA polymerase III epsilon subunit-like protein